MSIEAYMKNNLNGKGVSNYEIMAEEGRKRFASMDMKEITARTGVPLEDGFFRLSFLGQEYRVFAKDGSISDTEGKPADHNVSMILYDLLGYAEEGARASGEYTQVQNLSKVISTVKYAGEGMYDEHARRMDGKEQQLSAACRSLGGEPWGKGDVSYRIPMYRDLSVVFSFWSSDDEFSASASVLFDLNSLQYMHYETLWYCIGHIFSSIEKLMQ